MGFFDWLSSGNPDAKRDVEDAALIGGGYYLHKQRQEDSKQYAQPDFEHTYSGKNWCRFRSVHSRCMFPYDIDEAETKRQGRLVWQAKDRGFCPRMEAQDQKACPIGEAGADSGERDARPNVNVEGQVYGEDYNPGVDVSKLGQQQADPEISNRDGLG